MGVVLERGRFVGWHFVVGRRGWRGRCDNDVGGRKAGAEKLCNIVSQTSSVLLSFIGFERLCATNMDTKEREGSVVFSGRHY